MSYALLAFLVILVLAFGFFAWKCRETWRWYHITCGAISLLLGILFLFPTAVVLKSRSAWHKAKEDLEARLVTLEADQQRLKLGDSPTGDDGTGAYSLKEQLNLAGLESGRFWPHLRAQSATSQGAITLVRAAPPAATAEGEPAPAADEAADPAAAAPPVANVPLIPQGLIVYGFSETRQEGIARPIPVFYLGEFRVTSSSPTQVVIEPTFRLEPAQVQAISSGNAPLWSLYERLPIDSHDVFLMPQTESTDEALFGAIDVDAVRGLLGRGANPATIETYLRDGSPARPDDPAETRWVKIEFTQDHQFVVDSATPAGPLDGGFFNAQGEAIDPRLMRGGEGEEAGKVGFSVGEELVLLESAAEPLIRQNVAKVISTYYLRPLNAYSIALRRMRLRLDALDLRRQQQEVEQQVLQDAINATAAAMTSNQETQLKLEQDLAQISVEKSAITSYRSSVAQALENMRQGLADLYRDNLRLHNELVGIHQTIQSQLQ